jgi:hypothetical protein
MKDIRSDYDAHEFQRITTELSLQPLTRSDRKPSWRDPSRCKHPPLKKPPTMLERLLQRLREGRK